MRKSEGGGNKIWLMNELHAHYETKGSFEALLVRNSFMVKQKKKNIYFKEISFTLRRILGKITLSRHSSQMRLRYIHSLCWRERHFKQIERRFYKSGTISVYREACKLLFTVFKKRKALIERTAHTCQGQCNDFVFFHNYLWCFSWAKAT